MLDNGLKFLQLLRDFEKVERVLYRSETRQENDVEHSYQLAMMAWFFANQYNLPLSKEKLLTYALVHDLVEVYAGDTPVYHVAGHPHTIDTKKAREEKALEEIREKFGHFNEMVNTIETYELRADDESRFIYELDKLLPALNIYLDKGLSWNMLGVTLDAVKSEKRKKITSTKELVALLEELLKRLESEQENLFKNR